ncbi:MAG: hypothetical protein KDD55_06435 [Bdellovibrionales bacterium]|nr:hypothetical protein [Bdellovibrionales bacterium]
MYPYTHEDVVACIQAATNMNSALKSFLKNEMQKGDPASKFIKAFKAALQSKAPNAIESFLQKALPKYEPHLFLVSRHAFGEACDTIIDHVITTYAEDFNNTYTTTDTSIDISNREEFEKLAQQALTDIASKLNELDIPSSGFMKNAIAYSLFEPLVLQQLEPLLTS